MVQVNSGERMALDDLKERNKAIDLAVGQIEKQFGKGSIMRLGQKSAIAPIEAISTGSISIDYALGVGGDRRRDGRGADGPPGAAHVAGAAEAHGRRLEVEDHAHLHQPAPRENR